MPVRLGGTILAASLVLVGSASAQQSREQRKCILLLNKGLAKVVKTQSVAIRKCARAFAKDGLDHPDPDGCQQSSEKVTRVEDKLALKAADVCAGAGLPTIGPSSAATASLQGRSAAVGHAYATISSGGMLRDALVECSDAPVRAGCKCQDTALNASAKLLDLYFKLFHQCKKSGLAKATITTSAQLAQCLSSASGLDPKDKLTRTRTKLAAKVEAKCAATVANPLPNGECSGLTGASLVTCLDRSARCSACLGLQATDNLSPLNCDTFDDGAANSTCLVLG